MLWIETRLKDHPTHLEDVVPSRRVHWSSQIIAARPDEALEAVATPLSGAHCYAWHAHHSCPSFY